MRASLWTATNDCSSVVAGNMTVVPMMSGSGEHENTMMVALMMVMPSLCGRDGERKGDDRE